MKNVAFLGFALLAFAPACQDDTTRDVAANEPAAADGRGPGAAGGPGSPGAPAAPGDAKDAPLPDAGPPPRPYVPYDVNHVLSTGQSNAVANDGKPVLSTTQPYGNLAFDVGVMTATSCGGDGCTGYQKPTAFVPLTEGDRFFSYGVETMSSGLANEVSKLSPGHTMLVSLHGRSGNAYACLRKGFCAWWPGTSYLSPFEEGMRQVADAKAIADATGKSYVVRAATAIHGENDHYAYSGGGSNFPLPRTDGAGTVEDYADALLEWQRDYEAGARAITGQTEPVPLFVSQYSHWNNAPHTRVAYMQLDAHLRAPGKVVVVGPTYALDYRWEEGATRNTCLHFTGESQRHLGEYFAKAYKRTVVDGRDWEPLRPLRATVAGTVVTVRFHVPVPPLVIDTTRVTDPGNYGFEWHDESGAPPAITNVAVTGPDTVAITLASSAPTGGRIRYAYTFHGCSGPRSVARGNLRDSDATPSQAGYPLHNWSVHFDLPVE